MENKKPFWFRLAPFFLLAVTVIGFGWWSWEHDKHCLIGGDGWHKPTKAAKWTAVPELRWVTIENEVEHLNGEFNKGAICSINWGGEVRVVAENETDVRLEYRINWAAGALCPSGARFRIERDDFATWSIRSAERKRAEDATNAFVNVHRRQPRDTDPRIDVFAWKWVDVADTTMVTRFNPYNAISKSDRCGILNGGVLFTIAEHGVERLVYYKAPTDYPGGTACPTGTLFFYKGDET